MTEREDKIGRFSKFVTAILSAKKTAIRSGSIFWNKVRAFPKKHKSNQAVPVETQNNSGPSRTKRKKPRVKSVGRKRKAALRLLKWMATGVALTSLILIFAATALIIRLHNGPLNISQIGHWLETRHPDLAQLHAKSWWLYFNREKKLLRLDLHDVSLRPPSDAEIVNSRLEAIAENLTEEHVEIDRLELGWINPLTTGKFARLPDYIDFQGGTLTFYQQGSTETNNSSSSASDWFIQIGQPGNARPQPGSGIKMGTRNPNANKQNTAWWRKMNGTDLRDQLRTRLPPRLPNAHIDVSDVRIYLWPSNSDRPVLAEQFSAKLVRKDQQLNLNISTKIRADKDDHGSPVAAQLMIDQADKSIRLNGSWKNFISFDLLPISPNMSNFLRDSQSDGEFVIAGSIASGFTEIHGKHHWLSHNGKLLAQKNQPANAKLQWVLQENGQELHVEAELSKFKHVAGQLDLRLLQQENSESWLSAAKFPLNGMIKLTRLDAKPVMQEKLEQLQFQFDGNLFADQQKLELTDFDLMVEGAELTGNLILQSTDSIPRFHLNFKNKSGKMDYKWLLKLWPVPLADGARRFVDKSVEAGDLTSVFGKIQFGPEVLARRGFSNEEFDLRFTVENGLVRYVSTMPPIREANATGHLRGNRMDMKLSDGKLGNAKLLSGAIEIPRLIPKGAIATYQARLQGQAPDMLAIIDAPPLNLVKNFGLSMDYFAGAGELDFTMLRPMRVDVPIERYDFFGKGRFENVNFAHPLLTEPIENAQTHVEFNREKLNIYANGMWQDFPFKLNFIQQFASDSDHPTEIDLSTKVTPAILNNLGIPARQFMEGSLELDAQLAGDGFEFETIRFSADLTPATLFPGKAGLEKPIGRTAKITGLASLKGKSLSLPEIKLDGENLSGRASLFIDHNGTLNSAQIKNLNYNRFDNFNLIVARDEYQRLRVQSYGKAVDLQFMLESGTWPMSERSDKTKPSSIKDSAPKKHSPALSLDGGFEQIWLSEARKLGPVSFKLDHQNGQFHQVNLTSAGPEKIDFEYAATAIDQAGSIRLTVDDLGLFVSALTGKNYLSGGKLRLHRILQTGSDLQAFPKYELRAENFLLKKAPFMAQLLSLASLQGLADAMSGAGLRIDRLQLPFQLDQGNILIEKGVMSSDSLGLTLNGQINMQDNHVDLHGVLIPAYAANSILGNLPAVGNLLTSRKEEGMFGMTYSVKGPFAKADIFVNPLSAITPGILRRIFEPVSPHNQLQVQNKQKAVEQTGNVQRLAPSDEPEPGNINGQNERQ